MLCRNHVLDHMDKAPNDPHLMVPITPDMVFERVEDSVAEDQKIFYVSSARRRFCDIKAQAQQYIEMRRETLNSMQGQFNQQIDTERQFLHEELEKFKVELDEEEANFQGTPKYEDLVSKYGPDVNKLARVMYEPNTKYTNLMDQATKVFGKRAVLTLRSKSSTHVPTLVWVKAHTKELHTWNAETRERKEYSINELPNYDWFATAVAFIDPETVLICGGRPPIHDAYSINVVNGEYSKKPDMIVARDHSGACAHEGKVYVFGTAGGSNNPEEYDVAGNCWTELPHSPRIHEPDCALLNDKIFIASSYQDDMIIFDTQNRSYMSVRVDLGNGHRMTAAFNDSVFVITDGKLTQFNSEGKEIASKE